MLRSQPITLLSPASMNLPDEARQRANIGDAITWRGYGAVTHLTMGQALGNLGQAASNTWRVRVRLPRELTNDSPPDYGWRARVRYHGQERNLRVIGATERGGMWRLECEEPADEDDNA